MHLIVILMLMLVFVLLVVVPPYLKRSGRRRGDNPDYEAIADEEARRRERLNRRRSVSRCDPERITPPRSVERYPDGRRLEIYDDGSHVLYDRSGDVISFQAGTDRQ